jgi:ElaB/YqjD/DUF883 family membrane-anchored ribosome-binding protein
MAEMPRSPRPAAPQGPQAAPRQEGPQATGQYDHRQEPAPERRDQAQALMTQGTEVAAASDAEGRNQLLAWQQYLENQIREKPLPSVVLAAGVGLLYALLRRR